MKKKEKKRIPIFEVYFDDGNDLDLARRKLYDLLNQINSKKERLVLVVMTELTHPEEGEIAE